MIGLNTRAVRRCLLAVTAVGALAVTACGAESGESPAPGGSGNSPTGNQAAASGACDLTEPAVVAEVFGGSVGAETPGIARDCEYKVSGGAAETVHVYYFGTAGEWAGIKDGYAENRGPLTAASGVGDEAFHPGDMGAVEIVVRSGEVVFAVGLGIGQSSSDAAAKVRELAIRIASAVG